MATGRLGAAARVATIAVGAVAVAGAIAVGHSGGELVYRHGAADAYSSPEARGAAAHP